MEVLIEMTVWVIRGSMKDAEAKMVGMVLAGERGSEELEEIV